MVTENGRPNTCSTWLKLEKCQFAPNLRLLTETFIVEHKLIPKRYLAHIILASNLWTSTGSENPDQTPQDTASGQVLHCLLTKCTFEIYNPTTLKFEMDSSK